MPVFDVWFRRKNDAEYHRIAAKLLRAMPRAGQSLSVVLDGENRFVAVDRASRMAAKDGIAGMVWVTES
jgi:hypothetical protein